jgi:molecular chaperone GrpE
MPNHDDDLDITPEVPELKEIFPDPAELAKKLAECEKQVKENMDKALRAAAERDNLDKRAAREIEQAHKFAVEAFAKSLLPVVDSLERGLEMTSNDHAGQVLHEGMALTLKLMLDVLTKHHLEQIDPIDQVFDPTHHEALTAQPSDSVPAHTVMSVVQKGYSLHGRLLRPAQVIVSKGKN